MQIHRNWSAFRRDWPNSNVAPKIRTGPIGTPSESKTRNGQHRSDGDKKEELQEKFPPPRTVFERRQLSKKAPAASKKLEAAVERNCSLLRCRSAFHDRWTDVNRAAAASTAGASESRQSGEEPRALEKIASGGELSRVMLALRTVLAVDDTRKTAVFDEVDAGIGGKDS
jgi:DNA repair protein RecN (Recombination protein N)